MKAQPLPPGPLRASCGAHSAGGACQPMGSRAQQSQEMAEGGRYRMPAAGGTEPLLSFKVHRNFCVRCHNRSTFGPYFGPYFKIKIRFGFNCPLGNCH